jgi:hypothetical protein
MARRMSPVREREFEKLAAFIDYHATQFGRIDPTSPTHPTSSLAEIVGKVGKSKALEGLRQAANDIIESLSASSQEEVSRIDDELRAAGIVTVSELLVNHSRLFQKILKRGSIRNETEYYLVKGIVDGTAVSPQQVQKLFAILSEFEERQA